MMNRMYLLIFWAILGFACAGADGEANKETSKGQEFNILHYNITIAPDLSNRMDHQLYPKPIEDQVIVNSILDNIYPSILTSKRSENQKDKISLSFINNMLISRYQVEGEKLRFDFGSFKNQKERIDYLKDRIPERYFSTDLKNFKSAYGNLVQKALRDPHGADLWTYLNSRINDGVAVLPEEKPIQYNGSIYHNLYKNVLILITDGYIEAGLYGANDCPTENSCYYLSSSRIARFRSDFLNSGEKDMATSPKQSSPAGPGDFGDGTVRSFLVRGRKCDGTSYR